MGDGAGGMERSCSHLSSGQFQLDQEQTRITSITTKRFVQTSQTQHEPTLIKYFTTSAMITFGLNNYLVSQFLIELTLPYLQMLITKTYFQHCHVFSFTFE